MNRTLCVLVASFAPLFLLSCQSHLDVSQHPPFDAYVGKSTTATRPFRIMQSPEWGLVAVALDEDFIPSQGGLISRPDGLSSIVSGAGTPLGTGALLGITDRESNYFDEMESFEQVAKVPERTPIVVKRVDFYAKYYVGGPFIPNLKRQSAAIARLDIHLPQGDFKDVLYGCGYGSIDGTAVLHPAPWEPLGTEEQRPFYPD